MNTADLQGDLPSDVPPDWDEFQKPLFTPLYEAVLRQSRLRRGQHVLDIGCGAGLLCRLAAHQGAVVAGIDAAEGMIIEARSRTRSVEFHVGDMETLPFADDSFDLVTGFNSFQFAADPANALREARRVMKPHGLVAMATWGAIADCQAAEFLRAQESMLRPKTASAAGPFTLSAAGALESMLAQAGLRATTFGEVATPFVFKNDYAAFRAVVSSHVGASAAYHYDADALHAILTHAIEPFKRPDGSYRMENTLQYILAQA